MEKKLILLIIFAGLVASYFRSDLWFAGYAVVLTILMYFLQGASDVTDTGFDGYKGSYKHGYDNAAQMAVEGLSRGQIEMELLKAGHPDEFKRGVKSFIKKEYKL